MVTDWLTTFIDRMTKKCNYNSVNFDITAVKEEEFWKILFSRIIFDIKKPEGQKTLLNLDDFTIEQFSLPLDAFLKFYDYLQTVDVAKITYPGSFAKLSENMFFNLGKYKLCFLGNFPGKDISFYGRGTARSYHGVDKPVYFLNYYIQNHVLARSYRSIDLSSLENPQRDVFEAVNHYWGTNFQQYNLSSNNCGIYLPIYDASISGVKVKQSKFVIRIDFDSTMVKLDELSLSLIANLGTRKYSQKHPVKESKVDVDIGFTPSYATIYLHKSKEKLDEYNYQTDIQTQDSEFISPKTQLEDQIDSVIINPIFQGRNFILDENLCFVLMPFRKQFNEIYQNHIKPVVEKNGFNVLRADDLFRTSSVMEDIWEYISKARFLIADVTGRNPNVFYEVGIAHTIGKNVILITQNKEDIPFDVKHIRFFTYSHDEKGLKKLESDLNNVIATISQG